VSGVWPVADVRAAEDALMATLPEGALMQRAAHGLAVHCGRLCAERSGRVYGARIALLAGAGNNGGDALYAGARLARRGARVCAVLLNPERAHPDGLAALRAAGGEVIEAAAPDQPEAVDGAPAVDGAGMVDRAVGGRAVGGARAVDRAERVVRAADLVVDGIVGIGGSGGLRPVAARLAAAAREGGALRVAVDIPSGVDSDTGGVPGEAFSAQVTVTFGCVKPGLLVGAGAVAAGRVELVDIGLLPFLPAARLEALTLAEVASALPRPGPVDDKYTRGVVGVAAGSTRYTGAALLCTGAAAHGPAGMVRYAGGAAALVQSRLPEVVASSGAPSQAGRVQAWVVGPGIGTDDAAERMLADVLGTDVPVLVDADGITVLARRPELLAARRAPTVVTPHDREFARLTGAEPGPDRLGAVRRAAADLGVVVLLKGDATLVARPDGTAYVDRRGTPWLATAGSGDVLSGMVGALLAAGLEPGLAAAAGTYLHGVAGRFAAESGVPTAADVLAAVPRAFAAAGYAGDLSTRLSTGRPVVHRW
jgi:ADP-dependent NAD(P)H-hydrate dehydratase / NAD(P)H-hydrate epimerase